MAFNGTGGPPYRPMSEINVTPMVDVMLVLLVIFMITAPLIHHGVDIKLPETKTATINVEKDLIIVTLTKDSKVYLGSTEIQIQQLPEKLKSNLKLSTDRSVYLRADEKLSYGFVMKIMAILKDAGVQNIGMVTNPPNSNPS